MQLRLLSLIAKKIGRLYLCSKDIICALFICYISVMGADVAAGVVAGVVAGVTDFMY